MDSFHRRVWRWHFWAGLLACPALLVVSLTGAIYTFHEEIEDWQQADLRFVKSVGLVRPLSNQLAAVCAAYPDWKLTQVLLPADPLRSTIVQVEGPGAPGGVLPAVFVNPYSAQVMGVAGLRSAFFSTVLMLHRSLLAGTAGRILVEVTTSWTLVLLVTGVYLWIPGRWSRLRGVWWPRWKSKPYVLLRDLHALSGVILLPITGVIALTGLFFTIVWLSFFNVVTQGAGNFPVEILIGPSVPMAGAYIPPKSIDAAVGEARARFPNRTLSLFLPAHPGEPFLFTARRNSGPTLDGSMWVDPHTGIVLADKRPEQLSWLQQMRLLVLPIHMGTIAGTTTKVLALVACIVLAGLATSGMSMWLARRPKGSLGIPRPSHSPVPRVGSALILVLALTLPAVGFSLLLVLIADWILYSDMRHISKRRA